MITPILALSLLLLATPPAQDVDLKAEIDKSVHALRQAQDLKTGSYGESVEATAWALRALSDCPRKYRRIDGPFVARAIDWLVARQRADGAICDEKASGKVVGEQAAAAVMALNLYADEATKPALAKALAFVGKVEGLAPPDADIGLPTTKEDALAVAKNILARRDADGSWVGPKGRAAETARAIVMLTAAYNLTKSPTPPPGEVKPLPRMEAADRARVLSAIERGGRFLLSKQKDGRFEGRPGTPDAGITSMALGGLLCVPEPRPKDIQDAIDKGLAWLVSLQKPNGSIHAGEMANYVTSASVMALARAGKPEQKDVIRKARDFLIALQADEAEGYSPDHPFYGGNSYGNEERPDLSNMQMALEALAASGLEKGHEAYKRALVFLSRCQNRSESNTIAIESGGTTIVAGDDGGATYAPGDSKAGTIDLGNGKKAARSYGSMTYALLKSFIFAGMPKNDARMKACFEWLRKNYTLDVNPGFESSSDRSAPYQGLFYYFHTMAKALDLYGEETIVDPQGKAHAWRNELCGRIVSMQRKEDGAWVNENSPRWWEGNPVLATCYAMLTLDAAMPQ